MKLFPLIQTASAQRRKNRTLCGFTLTDLIVVIGVTVLLAAVLLSVAFTTQQDAMRARCVNNLRQIGVGLSLYAAEQNDYAPVCCWPSGQQPWQTYEACRVTPGTTNLTRGYYSLGLLFRTGTIRDLKAFYCPSLAIRYPSYSYAYYTSSNNWPSTPVGSGDDNVRVDYNYYPQLRITESLSTTYGVYDLPKLTRSSTTLEFGGTLSLVAKAKWFDLNPKKSVTTDLVAQWSVLSHQASGSVIGLNALFPDGHVSFQSVRNHNQKGSGQPFDPNLWLSSGVGPTSDTDAFRIIMNGWVP